MMFKLGAKIVLLFITLIPFAKAFVSHSAHSSHRISRTIFVGNDQFQEKIISPDDIANLFGSDFTYDVEVDDEANSDIDLESDELGSAKEVVEKNTKSVTTSPISQPLQSVQTSIKEEAVVDEMIVDENFGYASLNRALDRETRMGVLDSLSLDAPEEISEEDYRQISYDPQASANYKNDRMNYGAYRRWKLAEMEVKEKSNKKNKGKKNDFFESLKKLGSGPAAKGTFTGVGVAEPPPNMKNVTPKKSPVARGRKQGSKKVITPDDIESLFKDPDTKSAMSEASEDGAVADSGSDKGFFGFMKNSEEDIPDWILDAEKAEKKKKALRGKKPKSITDDWRFWAACVAGAGFVSAFVNIYQQTGGFGSNSQELMI